MDKMNGGGGNEKARTAIVYVLTVLQTQNLEPNRTNLSFPPSGASVPPADAVESVETAAKLPLRLD